MPDDLPLRIAAALVAAGATQSDMVRHQGISTEVARRLLKPELGSVTLATAERALAAYGISLKVVAGRRRHAPSATG